MEDNGGNIRKRQDSFQESSPTVRTSAVTSDDACNLGNEPEPERKPSPAAQAHPSRAPLSPEHGALDALLEDLPRPRVCVYPRQRVDPARAPLPVLPGPGPPYPVWVDAAELQVEQVGRMAVWSSGTQDNGFLVGRAHCSGGLMPSRVDPHMILAFPCWREDPMNTRVFEVLLVLRGHVEWMMAQGGDVPAQALPAGMALDGEMVYVGRVPWAGRWRIGRVVPSEGACVIVAGGTEIAFSPYEVLVIAP